VGYYNHGHFIRFLGYSCASSIVVCVGLISVAASSSGFVDHASTGQLVVLVINVAISFVLSMALGLFVGKQLLLISRNMTTVEESEVDFARKHIKKTIVFPYTSPNRIRNLTAFLGTMPLLWPIPLPGALQMPQSDGTVFFVRKDALHAGRWPLIEHRYEHEHFSESDREYAIKENKM
jgi:hypothetical protein